MLKKTALLIVLMAAVAGGAYYLANQSSPHALKPQQARQKAQAFINNNLLQGNGKATIKNIQKENSVYKLKVEVSKGRKTSQLESYMSKDGKLFFTSAINIEKMSNKNSGSKNSTKADLKNVPKKQKPKVQLFVMSYCPFGTQMEKAVLPVLNTLGKKIDFKLKFVDYAMHGKKELDENLRQTCIRKNHPSKLTSYLNCFLKSKDSEKCLSEVGLTSGELQSCISRTDKKYKVTKMYKNKDTWKSGKYPVFNVDKEYNEKYGVKGSPTLIINGKQVQINRTPNRVLDAVCAGFENTPQKCNQTLSTSTPSRGFGVGTGNSSSGSCN